MEYSQRFFWCVMCVCDGDMEIKMDMVYGDNSSELSYEAKSFGFANWIQNMKTIDLKETGKLYRKNSSID